MENKAEYITDTAEYWKAAKEHKQEQNKARMLAFKELLKEVEMSPNISVTAITEYQYRFEFNGMRFDVYPQGMRVFDLNAKKWHKDRGYNNYIFAIKTAL